MWGSYGDAHKGVCLKFKVRSGPEDAAALNLFQNLGVAGSKGGETLKKGYASHRFQEVQYTTEFPEIDFFQSLGVLSVEKLRNFWCTGQDGAVSTVASRILGQGVNWQQDYWRNFNAVYSSKLAEWSHEKEHRLVLQSSSVLKFCSPESRKLSYRFADLAGVIFGIKTSTSDKLRILEIIEKKCVAEARRDFGFFQARYSRERRRIELAPLNLIRIA